MSSEKQLPVPGNDHASSDKGKGTTERSHRGWKIAAIAGVIGSLALLIAAVVYLMNPNAPTTRIRDIFIILLTLEGMLVGVALLVLVIQLAVLINLLQNEVRPILDSTTQTARVLRGTAEFISKHLAEPVIKLNEAAAAVGTVMSVLKPKVGRKRKSTKGE